MPARTSTTLRLPALRPDIRQLAQPVDRLTQLLRLELLEPGQQQLLPLLAEHRARPLAEHLDPMVEQLAGLLGVRARLALLVQLALQPVRLTALTLDFPLGVLELD